MGRAVYIVNADTGALIWKASHDDMKWAIPSSIAVVDFNLDGVADFLYFGDLGGQVFRVKLDQTGGNEHVTTKIASLGGSGASHRRFFEAPAISLGREGGKNALYVAIGSGYRAHPLDDETQEGFFVIRDETALNPGDTTVATIDNRNWELRDQSGPVQRLSQSRAIALDMESATIAANGFRFRVPYGTLLCVSDKPLHGELKLPGMASEFYKTQVASHLKIGIRAMELIREMPIERIHSRKLRSFEETAFL